MKRPFLLLRLIAGLGLIPAGRVTAQTFTTLHSFEGSDGAYPTTGLILSGNTLYGTAQRSGSSSNTYSGNGTVFAVNTDGTDFMVLHSFSATPCFDCANSDGAQPSSGLILSGTTLYGTASKGGSSGRGTVFALNTDGTGFTTLHSFTGTSDGGAPSSGLILSGNTLYGTAREGGSANNGTAFAVNTNGTAFKILHTFTTGPGSNPPYVINSDGAYPQGRLILSGNILYGTAAWGGSSGRGTVFAVKTDGTDFTNLHSFSAAACTDCANSDGTLPSSGLTLSGNTLYGTAPGGGSSGRGTVFSMNTDGTSFTTLHSFTGTSDGAYPVGGVILSGSILYGTASGAGSTSIGTLFAVNTDGPGFTTLYSFTTSDGASPQAGLILSGNTLYGTARYGGSSGRGTVFSLSLPPPQLTIVRSGTNVILTWPASAAGFTLQSTTNLLPPAAWSAVSPGPIIVNGQNAVTDPVSGTRKFFRLGQ